MTTPTTAEQIDAVLAEHGLQTLYMLADDADSARLRSVAATIARLEGELENVAVALSTPHATPEYDTMSLWMKAQDVRIRADAAERRVEAVLSEGALVAAAKAAFAERTGADPSTATPDEIDQYIEIADATIRAALAVVSGDTATTEG